MNNFKKNKFPALLLATFITVLLHCNTAQAQQSKDGARMAGFKGTIAKSFADSKEDAVDQHETRDPVDEVPHAVATRLHVRR